MPLSAFKRTAKKFGFSKHLGVLAAVIPLSVMPQSAKAALSIVVSGTVDLNFGTMTETGGGGTMVVDTTGARTPTGAVTAVAGGGLASQGIFSVSGSTGLAIDVSMTAAAFTVSNGGGATMVVNNFNLVTNAGGATRTITLAANPSTFPLGATLNVGAGQAAGTYIGNYTINANYQ